MNERNQKVLSRAIHAIFSLPKIGGVVCEISSKEHEGPYSLLLKAQNIYIDLHLIPKLSLFPMYHYYYMLHCCILYVMVGDGWVAGGWMVLLLLLLYNY